MSRRQRMAAGLRTTRARFRALDRSDRIRLIAFVSVIGVLSLFKVGAAERMHNSDAAIPGTKSAVARELTNRTFGDENALIVLLKGPSDELDRQGPLIAESLARPQGYRVLDPWNSGNPVLRPKPGVAEILVGIEKSFDEVARFDTRSLRAQLEREVKPPLDVYLTGFAEVNRSITDESLRAVQIGELLAGPILMFLLLWIFGTPIAAGMPLFLGGSAALAGAGVLDMINRFFTHLEMTSITLGTVASLAIGVDYSLLLVARFRSELAAGVSVREASDVALVRAGRTVKFAAATLSAAMITALIAAPASVLKSATIGILVAVMLSVIGAMVALPPLLRWAGHDINRYQVFSPGAESTRWGQLAKGAVRRPAIAAIGVLSVMLLLAVPVMGLQTGPPDPRILPANAQTRTDFELIAHELGGGAAMPFVMTVVANNGTIADERLDKLAAFSRELSRDPRTAQVLGPTILARRAGQLAAVPGSLRQAQVGARNGSRGAARLENGLARASTGADQLVSGVSSAARGAGQLHDGSANVLRGAGQFDDGIGGAYGGGTRLRSGLTRTLSGLDAFGSGSRRASNGVGQIARGIDRAEGTIQAAVPGVSHIVDTLDGAAGSLRYQRERAEFAGGEVVRALQALDQMLPDAKLDPSYSSAHDELASAIETLNGSEGDGGLPATLERGAAETSRGTEIARRLRDDTETLGAQFRGLATTSTVLDDRLRQLIEQDGSLGQRTKGALADANTLEDGLARAAAQSGEVMDGARSFSAGGLSLVTSLSSDASRGVPLAGGLDSARSGAHQLGMQTTVLSSTLGDTRRLAPTFKSGYAAIAGIKNSSRPQQASARWALNFNRGGAAIRILAAAREPLPTRAGNDYRAYLEGEAKKLANQIDATVVVGGAPAQLGDFDGSVRGSMPLLMLMLAGVAYLVLVPMMRSLIVPAIAVALNALSVLAAFGVLALAFGGSNPFLGGAGFVDDIMLIVVFTVTFGLSLDYAIFILDRIREGFDRTRSVEGAIAYGIEGTAGVLTGAAAIMAGVFVMFAIVSPIVSLRQVGVGLAVAVILDATLLRLVLLPAVLRLAGERAWYAPRWVDALSARLTRVPREPGVEQPEAMQA